MKGRPRRKSVLAVDGPPLPHVVVGVTLAIGAGIDGLGDFPTKSGWAVTGQERFWRMKVRLLRQSVG
jgi:hypothetical protein